MARIITARIITVLSILFLAGLSARAADQPVVLEWEDLVPNAPEIETPFNTMDIDQLTDLEALIGILDLEERGLINDVSETYERGVELRDTLTKQGLDVDFLLSEYERVLKIVEVRNKETVASLDGKLVRLPGYALPLEFSNAEITEMLLVPYVGACIHTPPPPANQTVYVSLSTPYRSGSVFEPIWITGHIRIEPQTKSLSYVDGTAGVATAYTIDSVAIEPYIEE